MSAPDLLKPDSSKRRSLPRWARVLYGLSHPLAILPVAIVVASYFGSYSPQDVSGLQNVPRFLQGSNDWGGANLFSATIAMYVAFGVLGACYVILRMETSPRRRTFGAELRNNLSLLAYHALVLVVGGNGCVTYDSNVGPNDFRNMFLFVVLVYAVSAVVVTAIGRSQLGLGQKLLLAPLVIYGWLILGWDGNTAKSGQVLSSHQDPAFLPQSLRHRVMLGWHQLCDYVLGDI